MKELKNTIGCPICHVDMELCFSALVLHKYTVRYYFCNKCGLIKTEEPYWIKEAYSEAISILDTGIIQRNTSIAKKLAVLLFYLFRNSGSYLDSAGGYGLLTRIMRDIGFDFFWNDKYCLNIFAKGFEHGNSDKVINAVTAFEVLEHVVDPIQFIRESMESAGSDTFIFSTLLYKDTIPEPNKWWYYAHETGQHITFYSKRTLDAIGERLSLNLYSNNFIHVLTKRNINKNLYKMIMSPLSEVIVYAIYVLMKSKTMSDHEKLKDSMGHGR